MSPSDIAEHLSIVDSNIADVRALIRALPAIAIGTVGHRLHLRILDRLVEQRAALAADQRVAVGS